MSTTGLRTRSAQTGEPSALARSWPAAGLIFGVSAVFTVALTWASIEGPRRLARWMAAWVDAPDVDPMMEPDAIDRFMDSNDVRIIGYSCLAAVGVLTLTGILIRRKSLTTTGAILLFLPTFGAFSGAMFFLAGTGILRALWLPIWERFVALGDIVYLPYMAVVWPLWQAGVDARHEIAYGLMGLGLLVFTLATTNWLISRMGRESVTTGALYRLSRHPQYLGWIIWSYGFMVYSGLQPVPFGGSNPGASLPWVLATVLIVAVAWSEEGRMLEARGSDYRDYRSRTPFLLPMPQAVERALTWPVRIVIGKDEPESIGDIAAATLVVLAVVVVASLPFVLAQWPPLDWWGWPM